MDRLIQQHVVVVSGLQGTGKTTLARAVASAMEGVVFSRDPLMAVLSQEIPPDCLQAWTRKLAAAHPASQLGYPVPRVGWALQTALLQEQLMLGRSVVLECVTEPSIRGVWRAVATNQGAAYLGVECVCSSLSVHQERVTARHAAGRSQITWYVVRSTAAVYQPDEEPVYVADALTPVEDHVAAIMALTSA